MIELKINDDLNDIKVFNILKVKLLQKIILNIG